jgi:hypothetical protein
MWLLAQTMPKAMWTFAIRVGGTWSIIIEGVAFYFFSPDNAKHFLKFVWVHSIAIVHKCHACLPINFSLVNPNLWGIYIRIICIIWRKEIKCYTLYKYRSCTTNPDGKSSHGDVNASEIWIDKREINGKTCMTFVDNGNGMDPNKLQKMLRYKLKGSSLTCLMVNFI